MDATVLKMSLAGLMHDMGKFTDKETIEVDNAFIENNQALYCRQANGRYTHTHALWTAAFIEKTADLLPPELNMRGWGQGDSFINLAAMHHKPESAMQLIVTEADRISSGHDREAAGDEKNGDSWREYRKVRLFPLFEQIRMNGEQDPSSPDRPVWRYSLAGMSHESLFPVSREEATPKDERSAKAEYQNLFAAFRSDLAGLQHRRENLALWYEHFDSLLMRYTVNIPSDRSGKATPDVSLYDHARTTAALASALYLYHRDTDTLAEKPVRDRAIEKFLLVSGDFFGIQDFIFSTHGDTRKYRSKLLRGRSFMVSLLTELAADMLCREIGLPPTSVVINAGGKFTVLAPNTPAARDAVHRTAQAVNDWLFEKSYGQNSLGLSTLAASPTDFKKDHFFKLWDKLIRRMGERKFNRIDLEKRGGAVPDYIDRFDSSLPRPLCPLCGKRPSEARVLNSGYLSVAACPICGDQVFLGANLAKNPRLAVLDKEAASRGVDKGLLAPIYDRYQLSFINGKNQERLNPANILRYWNLSYEFGEEASFDTAVKFINGYIPRLEESDAGDPRFEGIEEEIKEAVAAGYPKTFSYIAALARSPDPERDAYTGVEALAVLKADVDDLGKLMACGLDETSFTISRKATLSRQLDFFFTVHLPHLLESDEKYRDVYTVFAGGDDLFLIGPWNRIIDLVGKLDDDFKRYVCHNPEIHFSAGVTLHKPNTPVDAMAEAAEEALQASKYGQKHKITLFGETVGLKDYGRLLDMRETIRGWLEKSWINRAMLYSLCEIINLAAREKRLVGSERVMKVEDLDCVRWRSLLAYNTARNVGPELDKEERPQVAASVHEQLAACIEEYGSAIKIPVWDILYNIRR